MMYDNLHNNLAPTEIYRVARDSHYGLKLVFENRPIKALSTDMEMTTG